LFTYVQGSWINGTAQLRWETRGDQEVNHYQLERSTDGVSFVRVADIKSRASTGSAVYEFADPAGANASRYFYRIIAIDKAGRRTISTQVVVKTIAGSKGVAVYPNPLAGKVINLQLNQLPRGQYFAELISMQGRTVSLGKIELSGGNSTVNLSLPSTLAAGQYLFRLRGHSHSFHEKLLIQ
jgi:hypothetical protein